MAEVTAQMVKELRDKTGGGISLCKEALVQCDGDFEEAEMFIRKKDKDKAAKRSERATGQGIVFCEAKDGLGAMVELACETDFVAKNEKFVKLGNDILKAAATADDFSDLNNLKLEDGKTISEAMEEAVGVIGENMRFKQAARINAPEGGMLGLYKHFNEKAASIVAIALEGADVGNEKLETLGKDVCMHITSCRPMGLVKEDIPEDLVNKEREVFKEEVKDKPENIQEKIMEGKLSKFYAGKCLSEQGFVKDESVKVKDHVSAVAKEAGGSAEIKGFIRFELGLDPVVVNGEYFGNA